MFPLILNFESLCSTPFLHIRSKAFSKSKKTVSTLRFLSLDVCMIDCKRVSWSIVDLLHLKPDCVSPTLPFCSNIGMSLLFTIVSVTLHITEVSEMGLYDAGSCGFLFGLSIGIIVLSFQESGSCLCVHVKLMSLRSVNLVLFGNCFNIS